MRRMPWGIPTVAAAIALAALVHFGAIAAIGVVAEAMGRPTAFRDVGDIFVKLGEIATYVDARLQAAATGQALPAPPQILGDVVTARIAYVVGVLNFMAMTGIVAFTIRRSPRQLARDLGLARYDIWDAWRPIVAAVAVLFLLAGYAAVMRAAGIGWLQPGDAAPGPVLRDGWALGLFALVSVGLAPLVEELFFRGLVFGGLLGFGFVPAAATSALLFAVWHLDVAAIVPVTTIGLVLAWLAWSRGSLWDAVIFHLAFNGVSFFQVLGARS